MIKLLLLILFLFMGVHSLRADDSPGTDQQFLQGLDTVKDPFDDGLPKPVVVQEPVPVEAPKPIAAAPKPQPPARVVEPVVTLPVLDLQGIILGEGIHQVIINDQVVPLSGTIEGVRVDSVTKEGVGLLFRGKKFFLKID